MTDRYTLRETIFDLLHKERERQDAKWSFPQEHSIAEWITILAEEFGEAAMEANELHFRGERRAEFETELIQVAAVCVSILEHMNRAQEEELL